MDTRRVFFARLLGLMAGPALVTGCKRNPSRPAAPTPAPATGGTPRPGSPLPQVEPVVRVRVYRERGNDLATLGRVGQTINIRHVEYDEGGKNLPAPVLVRIEGRGWRLVDGALNVTDADPGGSLLCETTDGEPINLLPRERRYRGRLRLVWRSDQGPGAFDVINHVPLESYLPSVLASELFSHWKPETYAAQAIAARSFASSEHAYFLTRRHYDLSDTVSSQVYAGVVDRSVADQAVEATRGVVLAHGGRLVPGYYSSCCGGLAARAIDAIGTNPINSIAPLDGRAEPDICTDAPVYRWDVTRRTETLRRRLMASSVGGIGDALEALGRIEGIEVSQRNAHGRPTHHRILHDGGEPIELESEVLFRAANARAGGLDGPQTPLMSSFCEIDVEGGRTTFNGRGFGHGVGLCQYGAEQLARRGETHDAILEWYYPGATLHQAYGSDGG